MSIKDEDSICGIDGDAGSVTAHSSALYGEHGIILLVLNHLDMLYARMIINNKRDPELFAHLYRGDDTGSPSKELVGIIDEDGGQNNES